MAHAMRVTFLTLAVVYRRLHDSRTEELHGAYQLTQGDAHENPKPEKEGDDGQGRKNPGEETTAKTSSAPAADTRPAL